MNAVAIIDRYRNLLGDKPLVHMSGSLLGFNGLVIEAYGPDASIGELCEIDGDEPGQRIRAEVIGFRDGHVLLMPFGHLRGVSVGAKVRSLGSMLQVPVGTAMIGRVLDAFGKPLDGGPMFQVEAHLDILREPINPLRRAPLSEVLETGVRAIDGMLPLAKGQRVGIFAGSGVGKSTLLGMMAGHVRADVVVVAMIGERGREVGDFLREALTAEGRERAIMLVATADQPALVRTHAVHAAHAVAEYFRDLGQDVFLIVDSITRFAMAQREVGLAAGEPPTSRGYPPSVFNLLPQILERGGRVREGGSITAIYSVLVEGDDMNEPVADHMRAILDGHVVLSRELATRGQLPAIDLLASVSRLMSRVCSQAELQIISRIKAIISTYETSRDLVDMGAYQAGANPALDEAILLYPRIVGCLCQAPADSSTRAESFQLLHEIASFKGAGA
ncbi:FliI/YscN family ATPase [Dyella tabacisoli]|uniref:protein-secreting ATPase n=1 Tax=Dyella tabacisoli TaxID=2282381 RepID=A0A369UNY4_9GAMM|nr:FliI/YscN family ATPase [Dyella tabacisoli]RDD81428.1 FliI/YscN family ATPase [Dyella tabacisoli]